MGGDCGWVLLRRPRALSSRFGTLLLVVLLVALFIARDGNTLYGNSLHHRHTAAAAAAAAAVPAPTTTTTTTTTTATKTAAWSSSSSSSSPDVDHLCLSQDDICTHNTTGCCTGFVCVGFTFHKTCQLPPVCLEEWHDCSRGSSSSSTSSSHPDTGTSSTGTPYGLCCDDLVCGQSDEGSWECRTDEIGLVKIEVPLAMSATIIRPPFAGRSLLLLEPNHAASEEEKEEEAWEASTPPTSTKNIKTTQVPGRPVRLNIACFVGEGHIYTFDGLRYDCLGAGEHVLVKSNITQRQVQALLVRIGDDHQDALLTKGVTIQDEGDTPRVELLIPMYPSSTLANDIPGRPGCPVALLVDGIPRDLYSGSGWEDVVTVNVESNALGAVAIIVEYVISRMKLSIRLSNSTYGCMLHLCVHLPDTDPSFGLLGTANGQVQDDWALPHFDGVVPLPTSISARLGKEAYDFCVHHYCIRQEEESLFSHHELGVSFQDWQRCDMPYRSAWWRHETFNLLSNSSTRPSILSLCGEDLPCLADGVHSGLSAARELRTARLALQGTCSAVGGDCTAKRCCPGLDCINMMGLAGQRCGDQPKCMEELGDCNSIACCGELACVEKENGMLVCESISCREEWHVCSSDANCCKGLACLNMHCRRLPPCMSKYDDCSLVGCCGDLKCLPSEGGSRRCLYRLDCLNEEMKDCSLIPCCEGLTCIEHKNRSICVGLPDCASYGESCEWGPCCVDGANPLACVNVHDDKERVGKQCRYGLPDVVITVFDDTNANGRLDEGEPGIRGVQIRLVKSKDRSRLPNQDNGGNAHEELTTNADGVVTFTRVARGIPIRAWVTKAPGGAVPTVPNQHRVPEDVDSDLLDNGLTEAFILLESMAMVHTDTKIGYLMPTDVKIKVFIDENGSGTYDEGERGIKGVKLRLVTGFDEKNLPDQRNGGNAHDEITTDYDGDAEFSKVPLLVELRVKVTGQPSRAVPSRPNDGIDDSVRSDLEEVHSDRFSLTKGSSFIHTVALGYLIPDTVIVRVWNDANGDGIQEEGEHGIAGVTLRLVAAADLSDIPQQNNGGNAHERLTTDLDGIAMFSLPPMGVELKVKVTVPPEDGIPTFKAACDNPDLNADFILDLLSDAFELTSAGSMSAINLGYRVPGSVSVRVWDDQNRNGLKEDGEPGIANVSLRLITDSNSFPIADAQQKTGRNGLVTFEKVAQGRALAVSIINAPVGLERTTVNARAEPLGSSLQVDSISETFSVSGSNNMFDQIGLGYFMPSELVVRVWHDANANGFLDLHEPGIQGALLRLVLERNQQPLPFQGGVSAAHEQIRTDADGFAKFSGVPKGIRLRVKVMNAPNYAIPITLSTGAGYSIDSDLEDDGLSKPINLGEFTSKALGEVSLGYYIPDDVAVRVWDDANGNGVWDPEEPGIAGVLIQLASGATDNADGSHANILLRTDVGGLVRFTKVPKGVDLRVKILNPPKAAIHTTGNIKNQGVEWNLAADWVTDAFNLSSFVGKGFGAIDVGYRISDDVTVRVWEDINGDGIQDVGEPGIKGISVSLQDTKKRSIKNIGGGSTAHQDLRTDSDGFATFKSVPKGVYLIIKAAGIPPGSVCTTRPTGKYTEELSSDLSEEYYTSPFNILDVGSMGESSWINLGFKIVANVVVRVWKDVNRNGIQDAHEPGIKHIFLRLIRASDGSPLADVGAGGTAHKELATDDDGRITFTRVPRGIELKLKVTKGLPEGASATTRRQQATEQLESDTGADGELSNPFVLASDSTELYHYIDFGFVYGVEPMDLSSKEDDVWHKADRLPVIEKYASVAIGLPGYYLSNPIEIMGYGRDYVAFRVRQSWKSSQKVSRIAVSYDAMDGSNCADGSTCSQTNEVLDYTTMYVAKCNSGTTLVDIYVQDCSFPDAPVMHGMIPACCGPLHHCKGTVVFTFDVLCKHDGEPALLASLPMPNRTDNPMVCSATTEKELCHGAEPRQPAVQMYSYSNITSGLGMYQQDPVYIIGRGAGTVTFRINQTWKPGARVDSIAVRYPVAGPVPATAYNCTTIANTSSSPLLQQVCVKKSNIFAYTDEFTAKCVNDTVRLDVFVFDRQFSPSSDITNDIEGCCQPSMDLGRKVGYTFEIQC